MTCPGDTAGRARHLEAAMARRETTDSSVPVQKAGLQLILDRIVIQGETVKLIGDARKPDLMAANIDEPGVIGFVADWRPQRDLIPNQIQPILFNTLQLHTSLHF